MEIKRAMVKTGIIISHESQYMGLTESEQRELLVWFKSNKPELLREIFCEDCPEHMEYLDYCENKAERGK